MKGYVNKVGRYKMGTNIHEVVDISIFFKYSYEIISEN